MSNAAMKEQSMNVSMPSVLAAYFAAEGAADTDVLERCFAPDAVVHDEGRVMQGLDAIQAWKIAARAKYQYHVTPKRASTVGVTTTVLARVTGSFAGSPVELTYTFELANEKIASMEIH
jgi:hypothetical protein